MKFRIVIGVAVLVGMAGLSTRLVAQQPTSSPQALLRVAIDTEVVDGNFDGAIQQYQAIVDRYGKTDRATAAEALLRMAGVHQKRGDAEARKVYERITKDYADQLAIANQARDRLRPLSEGGSPSTGPRVVEVLGDNAIQLRLSPDGRTFAMFGLALKNLDTGKTVDLNPYAPGATAKDRTLADAEWPVLSRDSKQVAYEWYVGEGANLSSQLRVLATTPGARPQTLVDNPEFDYFRPVAWSNDASKVLTVISKKDNTATLAWVSSATGAVTQLRSLGWRLYERPSLSPDGRYIAYSALTEDPGKPITLQAAAALDRHLYILSADGLHDAEVTLTAGVTDESPVWAPDGSALVFSSNRSGSFGIWSIPIKEGKASGPVSLLRASTGEIEPIGITPAGTLYYGHYGEERGISILSIARGTQAAPRVTDVISGSVASWSLDGRTLAFLRPTADSDARKLVLHSLGTGQEQAYAHDGQPITSAKWFPDNKHLLVATGDTRDCRLTWLSFDTETHAWADLLSADRHLCNVYAGPDGSIYYINPETTPKSVMKAVPAAKSETKAFDFGMLPAGGGPGNVSPDGRLWAIRTGTAGQTFVHVINTDGTGHKELLRAPETGNVVTGLQWSSDSQTVYWGEKVANEGAPSRLRVMQIAASGGPVQFSGIEVEGDGYPVMAPDGSHVALQTYRRNRELWALDVSSLMKAAR